MVNSTKDYIGYNLLVDEAKRQIVAGAMSHVLKHGLNGGHHFFVTFNTRHIGVRIPSYLHARYPTEMGIVIQHQYYDLKVDNTGFSILLKFDGKPEKLSIPYKSLLLFVDKGINFNLRFTPAVPNPARMSTKFKEGRLSSIVKDNLFYDTNFGAGIDKAETLEELELVLKLKREETNLSLEQALQTVEKTKPTKPMKKPLQKKKAEKLGVIENKALEAKILRLDEFRK